MVTDMYIPNKMWSHTLISL